jgi:hypothetical protein
MVPRQQACVIALTPQLSNSRQEVTKSPCVNQLHAEKRHK